MTTITVAHSPDSDDAFMHYALACHKVDTGGIEYRHVLQDIETLNQRAADGTYEVTAISIHAYALLHHKYQLLPHGASMGEGYGPMIVAREAAPLAEVLQRPVAIPGKMTSAYLALRLLAPDVETVTLPFDEIVAAIGSGQVPAGVLIHEGQLTYGDTGLHKILDLGAWWAETTGGLPLPLGGNAIRRDLGPDLIAQVSATLRSAIAYALDHRQEALDYALEFARDLETRRDLADRFVGMYVNERTLDYGEDGRRAVQLFLDQGFERGIIADRVNVEFAA